MAWNSGVVGSRLPSSMPAMMPVELPSASYDSRVDWSLPSATLAATAKSNSGVGCAAISSSMPALRDSGTLKIMPRGARAGRHRRLQVADVHVEAGYVHRAAAVEERGLRPGLVVPELLVLPGVAAAERLQIPERADRHVERIVDAAEAEALGNLGVDLRGLRHVETGDEPRRRAGGGDVALGGAGVGEDAVEGLDAVLVEVVTSGCRRSG